MTLRRTQTYTEALAAVRRHDRSQRKFIKAGALGGDGQDQPFEAAFSNLAHAFIRDKAPSLLDHELGFQLLDRNEENTKAVGIMAFKVGSHMLYTPVFFLQGDLKGHELLYIKNQDIFVPLKENWLNYIMNRKPISVGSGVTRNSAQLGVRQPDLSKIGRPPSKMAAAAGRFANAPEWVRDVLPHLAAAATSDIRSELQKVAEAVDLPRYCRERATPAQMRWLCKTAQTYPAIAGALAEHHGLGFLAEGVQAALDRAEAQKLGSVLNDQPAVLKNRRALYDSVLAEPHPIKTGALKVIEYDAAQQTDLPEGLDDEDREALLRDGLLIKDHRRGEQVSVPYNVQVRQRLFNPTETGLYMVLVKPGEFKKCFVAHNPAGPNGRLGFATVARVDGDRGWLNTHPSRIWCVSKLPDEDFQEWYAGLPNADSLEPGKARALLIGPRGDTTAPFYVERSIGSERGDTVYEVNFDTHAQHAYAEGIIPPNNRPVAIDDSAYSSWRDGQRLHLNGKIGTALRSNFGDVWAPKGFKKLTLAAEKAPDDADGDCMPCGPIGYSASPPLQLGNIIDAELQLVMKTAAELTIKSAGARVIVNGREWPRIGALAHLVRDHGLRHDVAKELLKTADAKARSLEAYRLHIKYAEPFAGQSDPYLTASSYGVPGFPEPPSGVGAAMGWGGQSVGPMEAELPIPGLSGVDNSAAYDLSDPGNHGFQQQVQQAIDAGQKEVFDTAMLGGMLRAVRDDTLIDQDIPALLAALDRLGRLLFKFYWHMDNFADRFGKQDLPELEDSLRNTFENLGDLCIFLKEKEIRPYPAEDMVDLNLGTNE